MRVDVRIFRRDQEKKTKALHPVVVRAYIALLHPKKSHLLLAQSECMEKPMLNMHGPQKKSSERRGLSVDSSGVMRRGITTRSVHAGVKVHTRCMEHCIVLTPPDSTLFFTLLSLVQVRS